MRRRTTAGWTVAAVAAAAIVGACGSDGGCASGGGDATVAKTAPFGGRCRGDGDCPAGLLCLGGDFAPAPFCTLPCAEAKAYCEPAQTKGVQGFCVELPSEFKGTVRRFCAPVCTATPDCKALDAMWSSCNKPQWKLSKLYPELPTRVCLSTETHGQIVFDPVVCDWEAKVTDPKFTAAKNVCKAYCSVLSTCKFWDGKKEPLECCGQRCFQQMTPQGAVDATFETSRKCVVKAYASVQATTKACDAGYYAQQCFEIGDPHAP